MIPTVHIADRRARPFWYGHTWVLSGAIARVDGEPRAGDLVRVVDHRGQVIDHGLWSPRSSIRVRLLRVGAEPPPAEQGRPAAEFWHRRVREALDLRTRAGLPSGDTTVFRAIHADADGFPGLSVDRMGSGWVAHLSSVAMADQVAVVLESLREQAGGDWIWFRSDSAFAQLEGYVPEDRLHAGELPPEVILRELGIEYRWSAASGQKTGHYCDQRENRRWFSRLARGARVLDAYCYTGGFAMAAARGGAASVLGVDSSEPAIEAATSNAARNGLDGVCRFVADRVENRLRSAFDRGERFDLVSLDPPKLAPDRRSAEAAFGKQVALCVESFRVTAPGGLVLVSSCSAALDESALLQAGGDAAQRLGRRLDVVGTAGHPEDHPWVAAMPEGRYLSAVLFRVR